MNWIKIGVELVFEGNHEHHQIPLGIDDVAMSTDDFSNVVSIRLDERDAEDLFWRLLEIIPKLRKDRR